MPLRVREAPVPTTMAACVLVPPVRLEKAEPIDAAETQEGATLEPFVCNTYPVVPGPKIDKPFVPLPYNIPFEVKLVCPVPPFPTGRVLDTSAEFKLIVEEVIVPDPLL